MMHGGFQFSSFVPMIANKSDKYALDGFSWGLSGQSVDSESESGSREHAFGV